MVAISPAARPMVAIVPARLRSMEQTPLVKTRLQDSVAISNQASIRPKVEPDKPIYSTQTQHAIKSYQEYEFYVQHETYQQLLGINIYC